jgi:hypothetical protein
MQDMQIEGRKLIQWIGFSILGFFIAVLPYLLIVRTILGHDSLALYLFLAVICIFLWSWYFSIGSEIEKKLETEEDSRKKHERMFHHPDAD